MSKFDVAEYLKGLSKEELLAIMLSDWNFTQKSKRQIDFAIWQYRSSVVRKKMADHLDSDESVEIAREIDNLSKQFNSTEDVELKIKLIEKIGKKRERIQKIHKEYKKIKKEEEDVDKFYEKNLNQPCD